MAAFCTHQNHRRQALAKAARCSTCRKGSTGKYGAPMYRTEPCIGCQKPIDYYSCAPGYCVACAHDPCWKPVTWGGER